MVFAIAFQATDLTGGSNGFSSVHRPVLFGLDFNAASDLYVLVCAVALVVGLLLWRVVTSSYGRALVGVRENERRMRALGYDTLHVYDIKAPLTGNMPHVPFEQSVEWICAGMRPLGTEYVGVMRDGLVEQRWVDILRCRCRGMRKQHLEAVQKLQWLNFRRGIALIAGHDRHPAGGGAYNDGDCDRAAGTWPANSGH